MDKVSVPAPDSAAPAKVTAWKPQKVSAAPVETQTRIIEVEENEEPPKEQYPTDHAAATAPHLDFVKIEGFKGFDEVEIRLAKLSVLTGPNNSGKSTVLQAIALAYECFRRCFDWQKDELLTSGRSVHEFEFLPVNQPKDLWYNQVWKPTKNKERMIRVTLGFSNGFVCIFRLRFMYGQLNIKLESAEPAQPGSVLRSIADNLPVLVPASAGPAPHESHTTNPQIHRHLTIREPSRVTRNILLRLQEEAHKQELDSINLALKKYFDAELLPIAFNEESDLEIRAEYSAGGCSLDVVSAGSGFNQILQLAAIIAWRKPAVVLLDEPDAHLHPSLQGRLLEFLNDLVQSRGLQVILATHSKDMIGAAPLEAIIPIDRTRKKNGPLPSIEHLLLEYQRQGTISNVDLAVLYQTKRCLFVEGPQDASLLPRIAARLEMPIFSGPRQVVLFPFEGVDKVRLIPDLIKLFKKLVGTDLNYGVLRDGDACTEKIRKAVADRANEIAIPRFRIWARYSLENYLLSPALILAAVKARKADVNLTLDQVRELLAAVIKDEEPQYQSQITVGAQAAYRAFELDAKPLERGAQDAAALFQKLDTLEKKLDHYPGKSIFGKFVERLQNACGVNIRLGDLVDQLTAQNAPPELVEALADFSKI